MRVVHVFKDFYPPLAAGITRYLADVADATAARGIDVEVHVAGVRRSRRDYLQTGVVVHRHREFGRALSSPLAPGLVRSVRSFAGAVIHLHMPNPLGEIGAALNTSHCPTVVSFHAQLGQQRALEPLYGPLRRRILSRAKAVIASGEQMATVPELVPFSSKVRVVPYGVSPSLISGAAGVVGESGPVRLLFVGRLVYYKGVDVMIRALTELDEVSLTVIGTGPLRASLENLGNELGVSGRLHFSGAVDDEALLQAYHSHHALVLPSVSRAEAFGLSMAEAMANGLPVISTRLGTGTDWVNSDGISGLVVAPNDPSALAAAVARLRNPSARVPLGAGARARALELFSFDRHVDTLLQIYAEADA